MVVESWSNPTTRMRVKGWTDESTTMQKEPTYYENKQWELDGFSHEVMSI